MFCISTASTFSSGDFLNKAKTLSKTLQLKTSMKTSMKTVVETPMEIAIETAPQTFVGTFISVDSPPSQQQINSLRSLASSAHRSGEMAKHFSNCDSSYYLEWRCDIWILKAAMEASLEASPESIKEKLEGFLDRWVELNMPVAPQQKQVLFTLRSHGSDEEKRCFAKSLPNDFPIEVSTENPIFDEVCCLLRNGLFRTRVLQKAIDKGWRFLDFEIDRDLSFYERIDLEDRKALFPLFSFHRCLDRKEALLSDLTEVRSFFAKWEGMGFIGFFKVCFLSLNGAAIGKNEQLIDHFSRLQLSPRGIRKTAFIIASKGFSQLRSEWGMGGAKLEFLDPSCFKKPLHREEKINAPQCSPLGQVSLSLNRLWSRDSDASVEFALIAEQVGRSPGNYLHNLFMKKFFPRTRYRSLALDREDAALFLDRFFTHKSIGARFLGLSVSSPYKTFVRDFIAEKKEVEISALVELTGACNTLFRTDRGFYADNTDVRAFEVCLRILKVQKEAPILILGAGSCALAFVRALLAWGFQSIAISSRKKPSWQEVASGLVLHFPWSYEKTNYDRQGNLIEQYLNSGKSPGLLVQASGVENYSFGEKNLHELYPLKLEDYFEGYSNGCYAHKVKWLEINNMDFPRLSASHFTRCAKKHSDGICAQEFFALQAAFQADLWFSSSSSQLLQGSFFSYYKSCLERGFLSGLIDLGMGETATFCYLFYRTQLERGACGKYFHPIMAV